MINCGSLTSFLFHILKDQLGKPMMHTWIGPSVFLISRYTMCTLSRPVSCLLCWKCNNLKIDAPLWFTLWRSYCLFFLYTKCNHVLSVWISFWSRENHKPRKGARCVSSLNRLYLNWTWNDSCLQETAKS